MASSSNDDIIFIQEVDPEANTTKSLKRKLHRAPLIELDKNTIGSDVNCKKPKTSPANDEIIDLSESHEPDQAFQCKAPRTEPVKLESANLKSEIKPNILKRSNKIDIVNDENQLRFEFDEEVDELAKLSHETYTDYVPKKCEFTLKD